MNFSEWSTLPENNKILKEYNIPIEIAKMIWDQAKLSAANEYVSLLHSGKLIVNLSKT